MACSVLEADLTSCLVLAAGSVYLRDGTTGRTGLRILEPLAVLWIAECHRSVDPSIGRLEVKRRPILPSTSKRQARWTEASGPIQLCAKASRCYTAVLEGLCSLHLTDGWLGAPRGQSKLSDAELRLRSAWLSCGVSYGLH